MRHARLIASLLAVALGSTLAPPADARKMHCRWAVYGSSVLGVNGDTHHYGFDFDDADAEGNTCKNTCTNEIGRVVAQSNDKDPYPSADQYHVTEKLCDTGHVCHDDDDPNKEGCRL